MSQRPSGPSPFKHSGLNDGNTLTLNMRRHSTFVSSSRCLHVQELCEKLTSHPLQVRREKKKKWLSLNLLTSETSQRREGPGGEKNLLVEPHSNVGRWQLRGRCEEERQPGRGVSQPVLATYSTVTKCEPHWASECQYSRLQMGKLELREVESWSLG